MQPTSAHVAAPDASPVAAVSMDEPATASPTAIASSAPSVFPDLSAQSIAFKHTWPNLPRVDKFSIVVSDGRCATLQAAIRRPRKKIDVTAGDYGSAARPCDLSFTRSDQWLNVDNASTITGTVLFAGNRGQARTRISGGDWRGKRWHGNALVDVTVDNVNALVEVGFSWAVANGATRLAIINSTLEAVKGYALFTAPGSYASGSARSPTAIFLNDDITVHNSNLRAGIATKPGGTAIRCQSCNRLTLIGNLLQSVNNGMYPIRVHGRSNGIHIADNQLENPIYNNQMMIRTRAGIGNLYGDIDNLYILNNRLYSEFPAKRHGSQISLAGNDVDASGRGAFDVVTAVVTGNESFIKDDRTGRFFIGTGAPSPAREAVHLTASGNVASEFNGYPPHPAGADH